LIYLGFITEGKLAAIFIKPSLGVSNWPVIYIINTEPPTSFSGAVAREKEDFCKGSFARTSFTLFIVLLYFIFTCIVLSKNTKKIVSFIVVISLLLAHYVVS
jgi:hypothetical protein